MADTRAMLQQALISGTETHDVEKDSVASIKRKYQYQLLEQLDALEASATKRFVSQIGSYHERRIEQTTAYELLARVSIWTTSAWAGYCAMKALNIGLSLPSLDPVVARSCATLTLVAAAKSRGSEVRYYKRRAMQACENLNERRCSTRCWRRAWPTRATRDGRRRTTTSPSDGVLEGAARRASGKSASPTRRNSTTAASERPPRRTARSQTARRPLRVTVRWCDRCV